MEINEEKKCITADTNNLNDENKEKHFGVSL